MTIREFRVAIPQSDLDDLHRRLENTRWPRPIAGGDWKRGVPLDEARRIARYWQTAYDWRRQEDAINRWPHFMAEIDGQNVHFIHVRSAKTDATPLLLVHGYPGSFVDFLSLLEPLSDAFHLVVPSLPGFGFSTPLSSGGWDVARTADVFDRLMGALDYARYAAQGGDIGAGVLAQLATKAGRVIGTLINTEPAAIGTPFTPPTDHLGAEDQKRLQEYRAEFEDRRGYLTLQSTRPWTIGYDLTDSPVGQLTWIAEKFREWTDQPFDFLNGPLLDRLLTNVSLYWFTASGATAAEFLYEAAHSSAGWAGMPAVPVGMVSFGREPLVRKVLDPYGALAYWSEHDGGGHFPAYTVPELLAGDVRKFFSGKN